MNEDSEEACLIDRGKTSSMAYTDGPRTSQPNASGVESPSLLLYKNVEGDKMHPNSEDGERKASSESHDSEFLGRLMNENGATLMTQFHADALKQIGFGKYQELLIVITGLALGAEAIQIFSLFFVLPSAELEFCMSNTQKHVLVAANLLAAAIGAMTAGAIAELNGRKQTLICCLFCTLLFTFVSAFMPTYGPFFMARICASIAAGGLFPIAACYIGEMTSATMRSRALAAFIVISIIVGSVGAAISKYMLPSTIEDLIVEKRNHFSSWHTYLLVMASSALMPIFGLIYMPESPRWLLEVGREMDALEIYRKMYCTNRGNGKYTLTELELPGIRSERSAMNKSVLAAMGKTVFEFFNSFGALFRTPYKKVTWILIVIWFSMSLVCCGLGVYGFKYARSLGKDNFIEETIQFIDMTFINVYFIMNMANKSFDRCEFQNSTFDNVFLNHVQFQNCTFNSTNFRGVTTSNTTFSNTLFNVVKFIDTNLDEANFINCTKNDTHFDRMDHTCNEQYGFKVFNQYSYYTNLGCIVCTFVAMFWAAEAAVTLGRARVATFAVILATVSSFVVGFLGLRGTYFPCIITNPDWVIGIVQSAILGGLMLFTLFAVEYYNTRLRCTALGLLLCFGHCGALLGAWIYDQFPDDETRFAVITSLGTLIFPSVLSAFLKDATNLV